MTDNPLRFSAGATLLVGPDPSRARPMNISGVRPHGNKLAIRFEGIGDRAGAEGLRGWHVFSAEAEAPEGAFLIEEVVGLEAVDRSGRRLGVVAAALPRPVQDLWEIETGSGRVLVPAVPAIVKEVDTVRGVVVLDPPAGLFDE